MRTPFRFYVYREFETELDRKLAAFPNVLFAKVPKPAAFTTDWIFDWLKENNPDTDKFQLEPRPEVADFFIVPHDLSWFHATYADAGVSAFMQNLPYYRIAPGRHVVQLNCDFSTPLGLEAIMFRNSVNKFAKDQNCYAMPCLVEDFGRDTHFDFQKLLYDVSFVGGATHPMRRKLIECIRQDTALSKDLVLHDGFFGNLEDPNFRKDDRERYKAGIRDALITLCPRGYGQSSHRFFDALSMGRIPAMIADQCELPLEDRIPYDDFIIRIPEDAIESAGEILRAYMAKLTPETAMRKCAQARSAWVNHLSPNSFRNEVFQILRKRKRMNDIRSAIGFALASGKLPQGRTAEFYLAQVTQNPAEFDLDLD